MDVEESKNRNIYDYLVNILNSSSDAIIGTTLEGTITSWNLAAERLYGFKANEAINRSISIIIPPEKQSEFDDILDKIKELNKFYEFSITDDGPGIDPKYHNVIFESFQTLDSKDNKDSTGLGLAIVKKIVESQGGSIRVDSIAGKGATFYFTWPKKPSQ